MVIIDEKNEHGDEDVTAIGPKLVDVRLSY